MAEVAKETAVKETVAKETTNVSVDNTPAKEVKDTTHTIDENEVRKCSQFPRWSVCRYHVWLLP